MGVFVASSFPVAEEEAEWDSVWEAEGDTDTVGVFVVASSLPVLFVLGSPAPIQMRHPAVLLHATSQRAAM